MNSDDLCDVSEATRLVNAQLLCVYASRFFSTLDRRPHLAGVLLARHSVDAVLSCQASAMQSLPLVRSLHQGQRLKQFV